MTDEEAEPASTAAVADDRSPTAAADDSSSGRGEPANSTAESDLESGDERAAAGGDDDPSGFALAARRVRREPTLLLPFAVAGVLLTVVDWLRRDDPLPVLVTNGGDAATIRIEFAGYPTGVPATARSLEALIDLRLPYLAWGIGLEIAALLVVATAGCLTIAWSRADERSGDDRDERDDWYQSLTGRRLLSYLGLVALFDAIGRLLGWIGDGGLLLGVVIAVPLFAAFVRWFLAPAFVVDGAGPVTALRRSTRATRGIGWQVLVLVVLFGLTAGLLGGLPVGGTLLSTALVGSVHAVTIATIRAEQRRPDATS
ncbi:hypothetical protein [Natrinema salaciae]|uniref:Uncharacterized protein n=1 Tax=Natrinema salaciae TaxID=1186196 RepID=A0A1H9LRX0_9EURY|nr:hypothetical protein [Natrinema salaciae]SER14150.1 hypothetical protein SAMN04489841_3062 [Natrinema salaciae]